MYTWAEFASYIVAAWDQYPFRIGIVTLASMDSIRSLIETYQIETVNAMASLKYRRNL